MGFLFLLNSVNVTGECFSKKLSSPSHLFHTCFQALPTLSFLLNPPSIRVLPNSSRPDPRCPTSGWCSSVGKQLLAPSRPNSAQQTRHLNALGPASIRPPPITPPGTAPPLPTTVPTRQPQRTSLRMFWERSASAHRACFLCPGRSSALISSTPALLAKPSKPSPNIIPPSGLL